MNMNYFDSQKITEAYKKMYIKESEDKFVKKPIKQINEGSFSRLPEIFDDDSKIIFIPDNEANENRSIEDIIGYGLERTTPDWYYGGKHSEHGENISMLEIDDNNYDKTVAFIAVASDSDSNGFYIGIISNHNLKNYGEYTDEDVKTTKEYLDSIIEAIHDNVGGEYVKVNPNFDDRWTRPHLKLGKEPKPENKDKDRLSMGHYKNAKDYFKDVYGDDHPLAK